ncbi:hypothetical protein BRC93_14885 [Halobacteriales archaeon QS_5_70_15]|nr:MAG: hypothetical protein BRC93_14885 [Halobacteriales archaeon QS_5_70_15]
MTERLSLRIENLLHKYESTDTTPVDVAEEVRAQAAVDEHNVWITLVDETTLLESLEARLADYKIPAAVYFLDEFPTTEGPNGVKIQKSALRDAAMERRS